MRTEELPEIMTVEDVLAEPGWPVGRSTTYRLLRSGQLPSVQLGGRYFIHGPRSFGF